MHETVWLLRCPASQKRRRASKIPSMKEELDNKIAAMKDMMKVYKEFAFKSESELKKDCSIPAQWKLVLLSVYTCHVFSVAEACAF